MGFFSGKKSERRTALRNLAKGGVSACAVPGYTHYKVKIPDGTWWEKTGKVIGPGNNDRDKFWREHYGLG
jgi:hypothetical protein